ncbi:MAG: CsbD family protein [Mycobacterium sp.]
MSGTDKAKNKMQDLGGQAREALGKVTGDKSTEHAGEHDQMMSHLKDAGEKVKDAGEKLKEAGEKVRDVFRK